MATHDQIAAVRFPLNRLLPPARRQSGVVANRSPRTRAARFPKSVLFYVHLRPNPPTPIFIQGCSRLFKTDQGIFSNPISDASARRQLCLLVSNRVIFSKWLRTRAESPHATSGLSAGEASRYSEARAVGPRGAGPARLRKMPA